MAMRPSPLLAACLVLQSVALAAVAVLLLDGSPWWLAVGGVLGLATGLVLLAAERARAARLTSGAAPPARPAGGGVLRTEIIETIAIGLVVGVGVGVYRDFSLVAWLLLLPLILLVSAMLGYAWYLGRSISRGRGQER
jgi:hypothetical protein